MSPVYWLPFIAVVLHILEEFVWPGGFLAWHRSLRPEIASSITSRFAIMVNAVLLVAVALLGLWGGAWSRGTSLWLTLTALLAGNAVFHLLGAWRMHRYSPGVVTGAMLYLPLCMWGYVHFLAIGAISWRDALISFLLGASYQFWSMVMHRRISEAA